MTSQQIIDAHVHLGRWRHPGFLGLESDLVTTVERLRTDGVEGVALTTSDEGDNAALLAAGRACPLPHWLFLWARPDGAAALEALLDQTGDSGAQGLKLHPSLEQVHLDDPRWDPIFALADRRDLKLMIHTGRWQQAAGYGLALERAAAWPDVQLILSHAGGDTPQLCTEAADAVARRKLDNVAFDMAGVREHWALVQAMKRAGHQRYMMGSDFPLAPPAMYIAQVRAMSIPDDWKADLLGGNALRLLGPAALATEVQPPLPEPGTGLTPEVSARFEQTLLVTGAGGPLGCNVTRSLRLCRSPVRLIGTDANPYHLPLALTDRCLAVPRASDPGYLDRINQIITAEGVDVVVPTHPVEVRALSALRDQVQAKLFLPPHEAILAGQDKWRSWQRFSAAGVPVPKTIKIDAPEDVERAFAELGTPPLWFRGSGVPGAGIGVASLPCRSVEHARFWVDHHDGWGNFMGSEYLPGDNLTWLSVWAEGTCWGSQTRQRLEYVIPHVSPSGITGAPAVCHTVTRPEVRAAGEAAVRALFDGLATPPSSDRAPAQKWPHGIFFVDLKCDAEGTPRVTEINSGRFGTTIYFYTAAGFNFPELALQLCLGQLPDAPRHDPITAGTYWLRTLDCGPVLMPGEAWLEA